MTNSTGVAIASRLIPAPWRELQMVAALKDWPGARARFRELGIPPHFFEHEPCRVVAAWALQGAALPVPAEVSAALTVADGPEFMPLEIAIGMFQQGHEDWALRDIDRHATYYAARWLPAYLQFWADQMRAGDAGLIDAAMQLDQMLTLIRPLVLATAAKAEAR